MIELGRKLLADVVFADEASEIGERVQRFNGKSRLVVLVLDRKQRSSYDTAVSNACILREALRVVGGVNELVGAADVVPFFTGESGVTALHCIIIHRDDE